MVPLLLLIWCLGPTVFEAATSVHILSPAADSTYSAPQLTVRVFAEHKLYAQAQISVRLKAPNSTEYVVPLRDDGRFPDEAEKDNIWTGVLSGMLQQGTWEVLFVKIAAQGRQKALIRGHKFLWNPTPEALAYQLTGAQVRTLLVLQKTILLALFLALAGALAHWMLGMRKQHSRPTTAGPSRPNVSPWEQLESLSEELLAIRDELSVKLTESEGQSDELKKRLIQVLKELIDIKGQVVEPFAVEQQSAALVKARIENLFALFGVEPFTPSEGTRYDELVHHLSQRPTGKPPYVVTKLVAPGWQLRLPQGEVIILEPATVEAASEGEA